MEGGDKLDHHPPNCGIQLHQERQEGKPPPPLQSQNQQLKWEQLDTTQTSAQAQPLHQTKLNLLQQNQRKEMSSLDNQLHQPQNKDNVGLRFDYPREISNLPIERDLKTDSVPVIENDESIQSSKSLIELSTIVPEPFGLMDMNSQSSSSVEYLGEIMGNSHCSQQPLQLQEGAFTRQEPSMTRRKSLQEIQSLNGLVLKLQQQLAQQLPRGCSVQDLLVSEKFASELLGEGQLKSCKDSRSSVSLQRKCPKTYQLVAPILQKLLETTAKAYLPVTLSTSCNFNNKATDTSAALFAMKRNPSSAIQYRPVSTSGGGNCLMSAIAMGSFGTDKDADARLLRFASAQYIADNVEAIARASPQEVQSTIIHTAAPLNEVLALCSASMYLSQTSIFAAASMANVQVDLHYYNNLNPSLRTTFFASFLPTTPNGSEAKVTKKVVIAYCYFNESSTLPDHFVYLEEREVLLKESMIGHRMEALKYIYPDLAQQWLEDAAMSASPSIYKDYDTVITRYCTKLEGHLESLRDDVKDQVERDAWLLAFGENAASIPIEDVKNLMATLGDLSLGQVNMAMPDNLKRILNDNIPPINDESLKVQQHPQEGTKDTLDGMQEKAKPVVPIIIPLLKRPTKEITGVQAHAATREEERRSSTGKKITQKCLVSSIEKKENTAAREIHLTNMHLPPEMQKLLPSGIPLEREMSNEVVTTLCFLGKKGMWKEKKLQSCQHICEDIAIVPRLPSWQPLQAPNVCPDVAFACGALMASEESQFSELPRCPKQNCWGLFRDESITNPSATNQAGHPFQDRLRFRSDFARLDVTRKHYAFKLTTQSDQMLKVHPCDKSGICYTTHKLKEQCGQQPRRDFVVYADVVQKYISSSDKENRKQDQKKSSQNAVKSYRERFVYISQAPPGYEHLQGRTYAEYSGMAPQFGRPHGNSRSSTKSPRAFVPNDPRCLSEAKDMLKTKSVAQVKRKLEKDKKFVTSDSVLRKLKSKRSK